MTSNKVYKIWLMLLDHPGEWIGADEIAYRMDLTRKQLYALLIKFPTPPVEKSREGRDYCMRVRINGSPEYLKKVRDAIMLDMYRVSEEVMEQVHSALPTAGWVTLTDLSADTGFSITQLSKALMMLDDAECRDLGGTPVYRRVADV